MWPENVEILRVSIEGFLAAGRSKTQENRTVEVIRDLLPEDRMYAYDPDNYFQAGADALGIIDLALTAADREKVGSILDFASGGGRVMRYLRAAFPDASLTACDVYPSSVDFCARTFDARPLLSNWDFEKVELDEPYDLIWVGSLFALSAGNWDRRLILFAGALSPGGVLVFTAYGGRVADLIRTGRTKLNLSDEHVEQIVADYDRHGFGFFADFEPQNGHGDTLAAPARVCSVLAGHPSLRLLLYAEGAWLEQDVIACVSPDAEDPDRAGPFRCSRRLLQPIGAHEVAHDLVGCTVRPRRYRGRDGVLLGSRGRPRSRGVDGARRWRRRLSLRDTARGMSQENVELVRAWWKAWERGRHGGRLRVL